MARLPLLVSQRGFIPSPAIFQYGTIVPLVTVSDLLSIAEDRAPGARNAFAASAIGMTTTWKLLDRAVNHGP
jgi:hypothetical protein